MDREIRPAMKLTVFVDGDVRHEHQPLYRAVLDLLREMSIAGATLTRGVMSYGGRRRIHSDMNEITMGNLPVIIEAVDDDEKVIAASERLAEMVREHGLVNLQPTMAIRLESAAIERTKG